MTNKERAGLMVQRIRKLMQSRNIIDAELARTTGMSPGTLSRILSGETADPRLSSLSAIAGALDSTVGYITGSERAYPIPILDWEQIVPFADGALKTDRPLHSLTVDTAPAAGTFAVRTTPSMEPRFRAGSLIIVEPASQYRDGQVGVVSFNARDAVVRRFTKDGSAIYLKRIDHASDPAAVSLDDAVRVLGVVTESRMQEGVSP